MRINAMETSFPDEETISEESADLSLKENDSSLEKPQAHRKKAGSRKRTKSDDESSVQNSILDIVEGENNYTDMSCSDNKPAAEDNPFPENQEADYPKKKVNRKKNRPQSEDNAASNMNIANISDGAPVSTSDAPKVIPAFSGVQSIESCIPVINAEIEICTSRIADNQVQYDAIENRINTANAMFEGFQTLSIPMTATLEKSLKGKLQTAYDEIKKAGMRSAALEEQKNILQSILSAIDRYNELNSVLMKNK